MEKNCGKQTINLRQYHNRNYKRHHHQLHRVYLFIPLAASDINFPATPGVHNLGQRSAPRSHTFLAIRTVAIEAGSLLR